MMGFVKNAFVFTLPSWNWQFDPEKNSDLIPYWTSIGSVLTRSVLVPWSLHRTCRWENQSVQRFSHGTNCQHEWSQLWREGKEINFVRIPHFQEGKSTKKKTLVAWNRITDRTCKTLGITRERESFSCSTCKNVYHAMLPQKKWN